MKKAAIAALYLVYALALMNSCSKSKEELSCKYGGDIKPLVARRCAEAGCHNGATGLVDFTNDAALKSRADNGRLRSYVFELKIMPPANADSLTVREKEQLKCWLDGGAVQN